MREEDYELESNGYKLGNNPYFGQWKKKFNFPPISYSNKSDLKQEFKTKLKSNLLTNYIFTQQIELKIILYLNEEKMLCTPEYGDLDNYAKTICDSIKGKDGLIIDDCQIQRLDISWIDIPDESYFEIEINSTPDDYCYKEISLYEMYNNLYYPIPKKSWDNALFVENKQERIFLNLFNCLHLTTLSKNFQHVKRKEGASQFYAYSEAKLLKPSVLGYHKNRVIDSGFSIIEKNIWLTELKIWLASSTDSYEKQFMIETLEKLRL